MAASLPVHTNWHPNKKHSDVERWICIYPAYINSKKTRQEGRRLSKENCVENPTYVEIRDVLSVTNLRVGVENKQYSREKSREVQFRGRIRVQMRNDDGSLCNPEFESREAIMRYVTDKIPQLKSRQNKTADSFHQPQAQQTGGGGGGGGKKGKNKKR
ncbi:signal recognition particle 19 kDa protein-like [Teleopsis dalmanni]|uniref:signal recognition particle 19 kDa protein-like n=1 Tax=Teleopsis dalmanni TaxID=139649 RepID=UPI0018CCA0A2|nr:signal recognition particle 19 kDa protein-like [Teleopsis dalmanni]XP_037935098.1 signal recognition particle 19 kDa protein-like [Teleopsis dalmanni]